MTYTDLHTCTGRTMRAATALLLTLAGCAAPASEGAPGGPPQITQSPAQATAPAVIPEILPARDPASGAESEPETDQPLTGARALLDESAVQIVEADRLFDREDFLSAEYTIKGVLQLLLEADELLPSRAQLDLMPAATDSELVRKEAVAGMRGDFDRVWNRVNALYDRLIPFVGFAPIESIQSPSEETVDIEAMNEAVEEGSLEPAPAKWQELRDLLLEMEAKGRLDLDMGLRDYPDSAWRQRIYNAVAYYTGRGSRNFGIWLERAGRYQDLVEGILEEEGIPRDMVYLCMIESGFSPRAFSRVAATGPWQFMWYTAEKYGLTTYKKSTVIDERRDFEKSTRAAVAYLKDLHSEFGSWPLAMAAYNSGEGRVRAAQRWARNSGRDLGYWSIYSKLPRETRNYVPYYLAALVISKNPARFKFGDVVPQTPFRDLYETVRVNGSMSLEMVADFTGVPEALVRELNPELHNFISPKEGYDLRIPKGTTDAFVSAMESLPLEGRLSYLTHTIRRGETGGLIAEQYGMSWSEIKSENNIRSDTSLQIGQALRIPRRESSRYLTDAEIHSMTRGRSAATTGTPVSHRVRRGDTISGIATAYGVTWVQIREWNGLRGNTIFTGQTLRLYPTRSRPAQPTVATAQLPSDGIYTIGRRDTLWDISQRFGVSVSDLKRWNGLTGNTIYPGSKLIVTRDAADAAGMGAGGGTGGKA